MSARERLLSGVAVPAHPLALGPDGDFDETAQRALTRYHIAAGADGLAVGVHTTQFDLHEDVGLFNDVLRLAAVDGPLLIAGVIGDIDEASLRRDISALWDIDQMTLRHYTTNLPPSALFSIVPTAAMSLATDDGRGRSLLPIWHISATRRPS
ncbi:hypothetical protein [Kutzneria sp. NPDC052558]|uniref:hypothetical protein n=1 Tax=Kutzneria sp. NPDC052558 TaxID=3364121 RepID=UPI0037C584DD